MLNFDIRAADNTASIIMIHLPLFASQPSRHYYRRSISELPLREHDRNFTRRQVAIQNRVASNIGISQSTFSVKVLNLFSRSRRKTNKRKSKHSAMLRNKETRHRMFIFLLNTTTTLA